MPIKNLPIFNSFDAQRFTQFSSQSTSNWYAVAAESGKQKQALYPTMGRQHVTRGDENILIYDQQPRKIFRSIDYVYIVVGRQIWQVNLSFDTVQIAIPAFTQSAGDLNFAYLPLIQTPGVGTTSQAVFCMLCDGTNIFVIDEATFPAVMTLVTDTHAPVNPLFPVAFGNRFAVSSRNSTQFQLTQINMGTTYSPADCFNVPGDTPNVFAQESGIIRQMCVLQNQLYIFTDFSTGIWSNTPSLFDDGTTKTTFPWRKNTSFQFNYGIADPDTLDVDFGMMTWLAQNRNGLVEFMSSSGQSPEPISTQAVNVLLQNIANNSTIEGVLNLDAEGFLYQYEDTVFYRVSIGPYVPFGTLDDASLSVCLEYNFNTKTWHKNIEVNGQRNRIESHEFFNNKHLVTVRDDPSIYNMTGSVYFNEIRNPLEPDPQSNLAFLAYPLRYENVTPIISEPDYSETITEYVEIDFVFGDATYIKSSNGFQNTVFIVGELPDIHGDPVYMVAEDGITYIVEEGTATPSLDETIYNDLFKPHIELYISDDGGVSFYSADVLEFSQLGVYQWRMRWYQGGPSRNRVYKLIAVSAAPIVILGAVMNVRRASGGAN